MALQDDLLEIASGFNGRWHIKQNNYQDRQTNFIYNCESLEEVLFFCQENSADLDYALHRWYNYITSLTCERLFWQYGATPADSRYDHDKDLFIGDIPYDVKLTVFPSSFDGCHCDLRTWRGKDEMISWLYGNQSQGSRKQMLNRIYVMTDGATYQEKQIKKCRFDLIEPIICAFMEWSEYNPAHQVTVYDGGEEFSLYSNLLYVC